MIFSKFRLVLVVRASFVMMLASFMSFVTFATIVMLASLVLVATFVAFAATFWLITVALVSASVMMTFAAAWHIVE